MAVGFQHVAGPTIGELRARLQGLQGATFRANLAQNLGEEARTQVANGFRQERDPYGTPWLPLLYRKGKILQDTGRMRASVVVSRQGDGFTIEIGANYAVYHQQGAKPRQGKSGRPSRAKRSPPGLPRRQMLPSTDRGGLGPIWSSAFDKVSRKMLDEHMRAA